MYLGMRQITIKFQQSKKINWEIFQPTNRFGVLKSGRGQLRVWHDDAQIKAKLLNRKAAAEILVATAPA
jgi:hypothetical protein